MLMTLTAFSQWQSSIVKFDKNGKLVYMSDAEGNKIPDFSYAGYKNGAVPIPQVPVVKTISPVSGDNTNNIQNAINYVASLTSDANGFRETVLLTVGKYDVSGTIRINASGIVLRGAGSGSDIDWFIAVPAKITSSWHQIELKMYEHHFYKADWEELGQLIEAA